MIATGQCEVAKRQLPRGCSYTCDQRIVIGTLTTLRGTRSRAKARFTNLAPRSARGNEDEYGFVAAEAATTNARTTRHFLAAASAAAHPATLQNPAQSAGLRLSSAPSRATETQISSHALGIASRRSLRCEWVKGINLKDREVANVPRHNYQMMHDRSGGDQRILE